MAWDSPRRGADPLARACGRQFLGVDELDFNKPANLSITRNDNNDYVKMGKLLSPIDEEGYGMSYNNAPLAVHLTLRFNDPAIRSVHSHSYYSSRLFKTSDRICRGLVRRIDHCSQELITRKDSDALNNIQCLRKGPKPWRFEMTFKIAVKGHSGPWAERIFISYQKQALNHTSAEQVLRSAHSIVGQFLQRHDRGFRWTDGLSGSYFPDSPETFQPGPNSAPNLACVPRSAFVESTQDVEFVPGYTLKLVFRSNNTACAGSSITRTVRIESTQVSPLNLGLGEDLLWQAHRCIQDVLDSKKNSFDVLHADCDDFDGQCQHYQKDALTVELSVVNNLGPVFDHLQRSIQSDLCLFRHPDGEDCDKFINTVRRQFRLLRSKIDEKIEKLHDFDFRIAELTGDGWRQTNCARFIVNHNQTLTRGNVEALLDRIRTGVAVVLREHDVAVRMIAYKRGHLVLDKVLVARERHLTPSDPPLVLIDRLKERIQKDIDMICKDTCSLDDIPEAAPLFASSPPQMASSRPFAPRSPNSYQTPPGSPASFRTRPPTPPGIPRRVSSSRAFPLVPIRYKETTDAASTGSRSPIPPIVREDSREVEGIVGLKPAAEVYASTRNRDFDAESNSTHSSMPTLAESDTPSPDHSMLITPSCVRSYAPTPGGLSFEESGFHRFSTDATSASSRTSYSEAHQWAEPKDEKPSVRIATNVHSVPVHPPKAFKEVQTQDGKDSSSSTNGSGTNKSTCPPPTKPIDTVSTGPEIECSEHDLPTEGWLQHCSEPNDLDSETLKESHSSSDRTTAAPEANSSEMPPSKQTSVEEEGLIGEATETEDLKHDSESMHNALSSSGPAEFSESVEWTASDTNSARDLTVDEALSRSKPDYFEQDGKEAEDSETLETCTPTGHSVPSHSGQSPMGVSERSDYGGHVTSLSHSDADSEALDTSEAEIIDAELNVATGLTESLQDGYDGEFTLESSIGREDDLHSPTVTECSPTVIHEAPEPEQGIAKALILVPTLDTTTSVPTEQSTESIPCSSTVTEDTLPAIVEGPETDRNNADSLSEVLPVPTLASSPGITASAPTEKPSESKHLVPELNPHNRHSWSSSSEWEDWNSETRQSIDSVDTIRASLHPSIQEDEANHSPDSPKRLRTPTAGLLGLSESRWADFGIRSALTGTHAFDACRPSTAPLLVESPVSGKPRQEDFELKDEDARPTTPHKTRITHHLRHKKSMSSILFMGGAKSNKLNKKQSRDLKKHKTKTESDKKSTAAVEPVVAKENIEQVGRFPRAMMLVAGLAFASSVVSRSST